MAPVIRLAAPTRPVPVALPRATTPSATLAALPRITGAAGPTLTEQKQAEKKQSSSGGGGFFGNLKNVGHLVRSLPVGAGKFVAGVGEDVGQGIAHAARHPLGRYGTDLTAKPKVTNPLGKPGTKTITGAVESIGRTAGDIRHPSRLVEAYRQGQLPSKLVEDIANVSLVAGATSAPLRAASERAAVEAATERAAAETATRAALSGGVGGTEAAQAITRADLAEAAARGAAAKPAARLGAVLHDVAHLGTRGANAPAAPYSAVARLIGRAGDLPIAGETLGERLAASGLGERVAETRRTLNAKATARDFNTENVRYPKVDYAAQLERAAPESALHLSPVEDRAAAVVFDRIVEHPAIRAAIKAIDDAEGTAAGDQFIRDRFNLDARTNDAAHAITPEAVRMAADFYDGRLAPEVQAKIADAVGFQSDVSKIVSEAGQQPGARKEGPLNPEVLGNRPMASVVEAKTAPARARLEQATEGVAKAGKRAQVAEERALNREIGLEGRQASAQERIAGQVPGEVRRAGLIERHGTEAARLRAKADTVLNEGIEKGAALRGAAEEARNTGLDLASSEPYVRAQAGRTRARAADLAEGQQAAAPPLERAVIGRPAGISFRQALRHEAAGAKVMARAEQSFAREQSLRIRADAAETRAADTAAVIEGEATRREGQAATLAAKPGLVATTAEREVSSTVRAAKEAGARINEAVRYGKEAVAAERIRAKAEANLKAQTQKAWDSIDAAPPKYRYVIATHREAAAGLADQIASYRSAGADYAADALQTVLDDIPVTLDAVVKAGIEPEYLPGGYDPNIRRGPGGLRPARGDYAVTLRKLGSENERRTTLRPATLRGRVLRASLELNQVVQNQAAVKLMEMHGVSAQDLGLVTANRLGPEIEAQANAAHYSAFDPAVPNGTPATITPATRFIPTALKREFANYIRPAGKFEEMMRAYHDPVIRTWKDATLPLSGSWHVGNVISNALMNTIGTGSLAWVTKLPEAWRQLKAERKGAGDLPAELYGADAERRLNDYMRSATGKPPNIVRRTLNRAYSVNSFVDDLSRSSVFLAERDRLAAQGVADAAIRDQAIRTSLKVSGDFARMTRFEQQVAVRIIPFYKWSRHVTQLVSDLAVHHPARLVWTMQVANLYGSEGDLFDDAIASGGGIYSLGNLNPLGQFADLYFNERGPAAGLGQSLNPLIKVGAAGLLGINVDRGYSPLRLPPGSGKLDQFGNEQPTPLIGRPGALLDYARRQVPLARFGEGLASGKQLAVYDTGEPMLKQRRLIDSTPSILGTGISGRLGILARQAGVPTTTPINPAEIAATAQKRIASAAQARKRYEQQLAAARRRG